MLKVRGPAFALAALFVFAGVGLWTEYRSHQPSPYNQEQPAKAENRNSQQRKIAIQKAANKDNNKGKQESFWYKSFSEHPTEWLLVLFNSFLVIFTGGLFWSTRGLWSTAQQQSRDMKASIAVAEAANKLNRENAIASRRAWLSLEDVKLKHPTKFAEDGIVFGISVTVKNLGQTPAASVEIRFESYFIENNVETFLDAEKRFKAKLRASHVELGHLLFPQDTLIQGETWADGIEKIKDAISTRPSGERKVGFTMFIGVSYRIVGDEAAHITYHVHSMLNVPIGYAVQPGQLVDLPRMPFLAGEAD